MRNAGRGKAYFGAARQAQVYDPVPRKAGPPDKLPIGHGKGTMELLNLAHCQRGQCIKCGVEGHYMNQDTCALRGKDVMDRPCIKCGQGLHAADDCVKVYQQRYVAPQPIVPLVKQVAEELKE